VATVFGDEIAIRAQTLVHDAANPAEVMRDVVAYATDGHPEEERDQIIQMIQQTAQEWAVYNFWGLTTREIAERLFISAKTADHHIQHIYNKIGVSTRAAAALWAMQNEVVQ
jgi:DNA-binding NarL/FixJ family response regulator